MSPHIINRVLPILFFFLLCACSSLKIVDQHRDAEKNNALIFRMSPPDSASTASSSRQVDISRRAHSFVFGSIGFVIGSYTLYKFGNDAPLGLTSDCSSCDKRYFWFGGIAGYTVGHTMGLYIWKEKNKQKHYVKDKLIVKS